MFISNQDEIVSTNSSTTERHTTPSNSDLDLSWDSLPDLTQLSVTPTDTVETSPPDPQKQCTPQFNLAPTKPQRRLATSEEELSRSNAFRHPQDANRIPPPFPRRDINTTQPVHQRSVSRIPKPLSPSQVDLSSVNDLSELPPPFLSPAPSQKPTTSTGGRVTQRIDYKEYHRTGQRREREKKSKGHVIADQKPNSGS